MYNFEFLPISQCIFLKLKAQDINACKKFIKSEKCTSLSAQCIDVAYHSLATYSDGSKLVDLSSSSFSCTMYKGLSRYLYITTIWLTEHTPGSTEKRNRFVSMGLTLREHEHEYTIAIDDSHRSTNGATLYVHSTK